MRVLHSSAPQSSFKDILTVIKEDFKKDPYEIFESIDPEPLGTASLAQVHKAILKNGDVVAVKIQHRSVKTKLLCRYKNKKVSKDRNDLVISRIRDIRREHFCINHIKSWRK